MAVETSQALQQLHHLLQQLDDAETLLAHGPKRIAAAKRKIEAAEQSCSEQRDSIRDLKKAVDEGSLNLKSHEAEILKLSGRLNEASSNKEYDIIQGQIQSEKSANEELEDQILTLYTQVDDAETVLEGQQDDVKELTAKCEQIEQEVSEREPGIRSDIERLNAEIADAEGAIPAGDAKAGYQRLRASMQSSALSEVQDSFCVACNTKVITQDCVRIKVGEFVTCRQCGRVLYFADE